MKKQQTVIFWTNEEQTLLEELLIKFPPEAVESQRFTKIAKEMKNRTPKQIASRVQKYFKKLHQANLPVPGSSNSTSLRKPRSHKSSLKLGRPSTFFPEWNISSELMMTEDSDDVSELFSPVTCPSSVVDRNYTILALLEQVRMAKTSLSGSSNTEPSGKCVFCHEPTFNGASWKCNDCETIYCADCLTTQLLDKTFGHFDHKFVFS